MKEQIVFFWMAENSSEKNKHMYIFPSGNIFKN